MTKDSEEKKDVSAQAVNKEVGQSDAPAVETGGDNVALPTKKSSEEGDALQGDVVSELDATIIKLEADLEEDDEDVIFDDDEIVFDDDDSGIEDSDDIDLDAIIGEDNDLETEDLGLDSLDLDNIAKNGVSSEVADDKSAMEKGDDNITASTEESSEEGDNFDDTEVVFEKTTGVTPPSLGMRNGFKDEMQDILVGWPYTVISLASLLGVIVLAIIYLIFIASIVGENTLPKDIATVAYVDEKIAGVNDLIAMATAETKTLEERVVNNKNAISLLEELIKTEAEGIRAELAELRTADSTLTDKVESLRKSIQRSVYRDIEKSILQNHFNVDTAERPLSLYIGSFSSGSARDTKKIAKQINTVRLLLEKGTKIQKITFSTRVVKIIGMYDSDPIKKSHWASNQELAMARAKLVASGIGYNGKEITISNDPEFLGLPKNQMRGVYVYVERKRL